jgi:hypothetical protein
VLPPLARFAPAHRESHEVGGGIASLVPTDTDNFPVDNLLILTRSPDPWSVLSSSPSSRSSSSYEVSNSRCSDSRWAPGLFFITWIN